MADIRINALTEASASVTTDFLPIDGSTGTRKLSAFNPTFGGNLTVGGDIVVSSNAKGIYSQGYVTVKGQQANFLSRGVDGGWTSGLHFYVSNTDYSASIIHYPGTGDLQFYTNSTSSNYTSSDEALRITAAKQVQVKGTAASTTTSSGALVVGNGTSGGLGVGGAGYFGGEINAGSGVVIAGGAFAQGKLYYGAVGGLTIAAKTGSSYDLYIAAPDGNAIGYVPTGTKTLALAGALTVSGATSTLSASSGYAISKIYGSSGGYTDFYAANGTTRNGSVGCETAGEMYLGTRVNQPIYTIVNGSVVATQTSGTLTLAPTTASTGTSSGALVVSGGVGVAGALFSGGYVHPGNDSGFYLRGTGTGNGLWYGNYVSADVSGAFSVRNAAASSTYFAVDSSNVTISSGVGLKLGNAYAAGAPTATGYVVIKDSTGTSYKIPAVAL